MNPVAASAASAAYQSHQRRNRSNLEPVQEHPWEQNQSYIDQLRKPASADAFQSPPWRQCRQNVPKTIPDRRTPTQRLDSLLNGPQPTQSAQRSPIELLRNEPHESRQLMVVSQRDRRSNARHNNQDQQVVRRKPTQRQVRASQRRHEQFNHRQPLQFQAYGSPPPLPRNPVPQDLVEGARILRQAGINLPDQGERSLVPRLQPQIHGLSVYQPGSATNARSQNVPLIVHELPGQPRNGQPIPEDLLESMSRLRFHEIAQFESAEDVNAVMAISEMPNSVAADIAGSGYELLAVADAMIEGCIPHSRIALAGLSGSGKTHCLRLFLTRVRMRAPTMGVLEIDVSHHGAIQLKHELQPGVHICNSLEDVTTMLQILHKSPLPWTMVVIEGLDRPQDADVVQSWCQRFFNSNCCVVISTRRLDVAKSFVGGHDPLFTVTALSSWMATYLLSTIEASSAKMELIAKQLSYHPSAIAGVAKLMAETGMRADDLSAYLCLLLSEPNRKDNPSFRLALEAASGLVSLANGKNRPHIDKDAGALFAILVHCVQPSWLHVFAEINRGCPLAMMLLGVLAAHGKSAVEWKLVDKIERVIGSSDALRSLQAHCLITTEVRDGDTVYQCPFPVLMAVQMWLAGRGKGALDEAFKLADAVVQVEMP